VSVVVLEWIDPPYSCGHWTPEVVATAGGEELLAAPGDRSRELRWGEILEVDPEVIVLACCGQDEDRTLQDLAHLEERPGFAKLRAVREGRVYVADGGAHFSRPGPRLVDAAELLAATLHGVGVRTGLAPVTVRSATATP
jgi:iron complex transport system substrate-binding protein